MPTNGEKLGRLRKTLVGLVPQAAQPAQRDQWFFHVTGMTEKAFRAPKRDRFVVVDGTTADKLGPQLSIENRPTGQHYACGRYKVETIRDLMLTTHAKPQKQHNPCVFHIIYRPNNTIPPVFVDVAALQASEHYNGAAFQLASNHNGVEAVGPDQPLSHPKFVTDYIHDHTQGPAASVSAGAAAIARMYAGLYDPSVAINQEAWMQSPSRQVEYLQTHREMGYLDTVNGYVVLDQKDAKLPTDARELRNLMGAAKVGVHTDCQVVFGRVVENAFSLCDSKQRIDQVCVAALNVQQGCTGRKNLSLDADLITSLRVPISGRTMLP